MSKELSIPSLVSFRNKLNRDIDECIKDMQKNARGYDRDKASSLILLIENYNKYKSVKDCSYSDDDENIISSESDNELHSKHPPPIFLAGNLQHDEDDDLISDDEKDIGYHHLYSQGNLSREERRKRFQMRNLNVDDIKIDDNSVDTVDYEEPHSRHLLRFP